MIGSGEPRKAIRPMMIAPRFLPIRRVTTGAIVDPRIAEMNTPIVTQPVSREVKPQK